MKTYLLPLALLSFLALQACNPQSSAPAGEASSASAAPAADPLATPEQRLSYGIALGLGQRMRADGMKLDVNAFQMGLTDGLTDAKPRLTQQEIAAEMKAYQEKATAEHEAAQAELGKKNAAESAAFLAKNGAREGVVTTDSGLQYEILTEGTGPIPGPEDTVKVHYTGTLVDGTKFDSSVDRGEPVTFGVGQVIPGWTEALQLMPVGSKWKLAIPADLAYGSGGAGRVIGPNAALIFEVELLGIPSQEAKEDAKADDEEETKADAKAAEAG
jgi:FKBP-type peptidyl-prolyl cis-trans isomerase